jgi:hypothetical protein
MLGRLSQNLDAIKVCVDARSCFVAVRNALVPSLTLIYDRHSLETQQPTANGGYRNYVGEKVALTALGL